MPEESSSRIVFDRYFVATTLSSLPSWSYVVSFGSYVTNVYAMTSHHTRARELCAHFTPPLYTICCAWIVYNHYPGQWLLTLTSYLVYEPSVASRPRRLVVCVVMFRTFCLRCFCLVVY